MTESIQGNELRGHLEAMVLSTLAEGPVHGFELVKRLDGRGQGAFHLKEGTVYPVLYRLERAGQVAATWEAEASGRRGPRRRIYRLTAQGQRSLTARREQWRHFVDVIGGVIGQSRALGEASV